MKRTRKLSLSSRSLSSSNGDESIGEESIFNITASLGSNSNDTQLVDDVEYDNLSSVSFDTTLDHANTTRPSFFEHESILFPKSKLIDYLNVHNPTNQGAIGTEEKTGGIDESTLIANEPKKESKKEKKLVRAVSSGGSDESEIIRLTLMSLELHANTRSNMTPNPDNDRIAFACYSVYEFKSGHNDSTSINEIDTHLVVIVDTKKSLSARKK